MKTKELIEKLNQYNSLADVSIIVHNYKEQFSITWGGGKEGDTKDNCEEVNFYVDRLCETEKD